MSTGNILTSKAKSYPREITPQRESAQLQPMRTAQVPENHTPDSASLRAAVRRALIAWPALPSSVSTGKEGLCTGRPRAAVHYSLRSMSHYTHYGSLLSQWGFASRLIEVAMEISFKGPILTNIVNLLTTVSLEYVHCLII